MKLTILRSAVQCTVVLAAAGFTAAATGMALWAQAPPATDPDEGTRQLWNQEFLAARPGARGPAVPPSVGGKATTPKPAPAQPTQGMVGVTVWQLRKAQPADDREIEIQARDGDWTPVRAQAGTPLRPGQKVRLGVESARSGYLYVIDREQYADGTYGDPYLIFPVLRTRNGNNRVSAGRLIEIPGMQDDPRFFTIRPTRPDQTAELLTVLVTPAPLNEVKIGRDPLKLDRGQVDGWEKRFGTKVDKLETPVRVGQSYTRAEKDAAASETRLLTLDEPPPQTLYRVEAKSGEPLLVNVPLRISPAATQ